MKNKSMTRLLSILLAVVMVFTIMPSDVYAGTKWYDSMDNEYEGEVKKPTCKVEDHSTLVWDEDKNWWEYVDRDKFSTLFGFCDCGLKGKVLSNKKVKISWTKNLDADGYEVVLSGRVKWYEFEEGGINSKRIKYDSKYTTKKVINKNVNTVTLSIPNAIDNTVTYTQSVNHKDKTKDYQSLNNLFQVRYRVYKIVDGKKIWSQWSVLRPIGNKGNNVYRAVYKGVQKTKKAPNYCATVLNYNNFVWYEHYDTGKMLDGK